MEAAPTQAADFLELDLRGTLAEVTERLGTHTVLEQLRNNEAVPKETYEILPDLNVSIQNVVLTLKLEKLVPIDSPEVFVYPGEEPPPRTVEYDAKGRRCYRIMRKINLPALAKDLKHLGAKYNTSTFSAVILHERKTRCAILVFATGNIVFTGCSSINLSLCIQGSFLKILREIGIDDFLEPTPELQNVVSSGNMAKPIDTNRLLVLYSDYCSPIKGFPGVSIKMPEFERRVVLAFQTGNFCHSGATRLSDIANDIGIVHSILFEET